MAVRFKAELTCSEVITMEVQGCWGKEVCSADHNQLQIIRCVVNTVFIVFMDNYESCDKSQQYSSLPPQFKCCHLWMV